MESPSHVNAGQRLLPTVVNEIAAADPTRVLYSITKNPEEGFQDITAAIFKRAIDRCAWYLHENLGQGVNFPTLVYTGPQDVVYAVLVLACIKTGYKLLLTSPRNSLEAHLSLLEQTECNTFLHPPNFPLPVINQILSARKMQTLDIFGIQFWAGDGSEREYPYTKTFNEAKLDPFVVLHTSGSTGMPKPIVQTHSTISALDAFTTLPSLGLQSTYPAMCTGTRVYLAFPLFHCAGISMLLPGSIFGAFTIVLGPFPPSADVANGVHVYGNVQHSCLAPTTLIDLTKNPEHLENLSKLQQITFGGGPCPQRIGDMVRKRTKLLNCVGTTECGVLPVQLCEPDDWAYLSVSPVLGYEYCHVGDDLYEQVIVRDPKLEKYQGIFGTFPDLTKWPMKDLYSKHPSQDNVWLYRGRTDDIIVFATGEKLNPLGLEVAVSANPSITGALVAGFGRFQASLLLETAKPLGSEEEKDAQLDAIWPTVQSANKLSPSHGRIHRHMIIMTSADKPMLRAGKGTVQRKLTIDLYDKEINDLYEKQDKLSGSAVNSTLAESHSGLKGEALQSGLVDIIVKSTDIPKAYISPDADLFELGLDSLQVTLIARQVNETAMPSNVSRPLEVRDVYVNPSVAALSAIVVALLEGASVESDPESALRSMQEYYNRYTMNLPISGRQILNRANDGTSVVLLTGATGSLGSYILDALIGDSRVSHIYCLSRGKDSRQRQEVSQSAKGLQSLSSKVDCLDGSLSEPYFGLPVSLYRKILVEVTDVVHNAWQVDFNLSINSFASHFVSVRQMIEFSAHSAYGAKIFFVSSLSAVSGLATKVAEQVFEDWQTPGSTGYGQAKFVSERILATAATNADIPVTICRVGQIAGPSTSNGMWPKQEWFPSLIASSKYLGILPESLGQMDVVDWIPVDLLGQNIVELVLQARASNEGAASVYHLANPRHTTWKSLIPVVLDSLDPENRLQVVPLSNWLHALRNSNSQTADVAQNPAVKILDFFQSLAESQPASSASLSTTKTVEGLPSLEKLTPVHDVWMQNWIKQWAL